MRFLCDIPGLGELPILNFDDCGPRHGRLEFPRLSKDPKIRARGRAPSTLNGSAWDLLTQGGAVYALVCKREGCLVLHPVPPVSGLIGIAKLFPRDEGHRGGFVSLASRELEAIGADYGEDLFGSWNEEEGCMVFERRVP